MSELLEHTFFRHALVAGVLVAFSCSFVGVYVVLKRIVFLGIALAQIAAAGVALALLLRWNPLVTALAASLAGTLALSQLRWRGRAPLEAVLGATYVLAAALGTVFVAKNPVGEARALNVLFGNILSVPAWELEALAVVALLVAAIHLQFRQHFVFVSFDFETAAAHGVRARFWDFLLFLTLGVVIAFAIRSVGVLVTFALLVLPAMGARILVASVGAMFVVAAALGILAIPVGLGTAFVFDLPTGATIGLTVAALFVVALGIKAIGRVLRPVAAAVGLAGLVVAVAPGVATAQADSVIEELRATVEQLKKTVEAQQKQIEALQAGQTAPPPAPSPPAGAAPPPATVSPEPPPAPTEVPDYAVERRGLPPWIALLPEIRLEGNLIGNYTPHRQRLDRELEQEVEDEEFFIRRNRFNVREVELGLRSVVDPFARFEAIFSAEQVFEGELEVGLEEGIVTLTALPWRLNTKLGRMRTGFGEFNDSDPEEIPEVDPPNVIVNVFGREGDGWIDTGVVVTRLIPLTDTVSLTAWGAVFNGDNEAAFHGGEAALGRHPAWFTRLESFIDLGGNTGMELGVGYAQGRTFEEAEDERRARFLRSRILNAHVEFDYRHPVLALYRGFAFLTEVFYTWRDQTVETDDAIEVETVGRLGLYSIAELQLARTWAVAGRFDYSELPELEEDGPRTRWELAGSAILSYKPSRWLTLRAQYKHTERNFAVDSDELYLQALFIIGYERPGLF
jgi:ABC-type Mn2+/Zn2+ transport system permease subunit